MILLDVVRDLSSLSSDDTIYAVEPWSKDSLAIVATEPEDGSLPAEARKDMTYFLEVFIAQEFMEDYVSSEGREQSIEELCARLIRYAITDA